MLGTFLQQPTCQHKGDNHHRGIKIGVPLNALCSPEGFAPEGVESTEEEGNARREGNQRVHIGRGMSQLPDGVHEELPAWVKQIQQGENQHGLVCSIARTNR